LKNAKNKINSLSQQLNENSVRIMELEIEISSMKDSITYQLTSKFHNCFIERLLPDRGKNLCKLGLKGGRILVNEGVGSFWWNFNNYLHDKKKGIKEIEIIVVDSGSTNDTIDLTKVYATKIIENTFRRIESWWHSKSCNRKSYW
jgi:hypothetical protein